jgi:hypothetical protein
MKKPNLILIIGIGITALFVTSAYSDTTGTIAGYVLDKETNMSIPGARVQISGANMTAMVNPFDGSYAIKNIWPGTYTIVASCIGYQKVTSYDITVLASLTMILNIILASEVIYVGDGYKPCTRPVIDKYKTRSITKINGERLRSRPGTSLNLKGLID